MTDLLGNIALVIAFVLIGGVFAATEMALVTLRDSQIATIAARGRRGRKVAALARTPNVFLSAVQIGVTVAGFASAAFGATSIAPSLASVFESWGMPESAALSVADRRAHPRHRLPLARSRGTRAEAARAPTQTPSSPTP